MSCLRFLSCDCHAAISGQKSVEITISDRNGEEVQTRFHTRDPEWRSSTRIHPWIMIAVKEGVISCAIPARLTPHTVDQNVDEQGRPAHRLPSVSTRANQ